MRTIYRSWKDKRSGYTRRMRMFVDHQPKTPTEECDIRLCLEDVTEGLANHYFKTEEAAQALWAAFKAGTVDFRGRAK